MSVVPIQQPVERRDLAAILPPGYDPESVAGKTPTKLRKTVAQQNQVVAAAHNTAAGQRLAAAESAVSLRTNVMDSMSLLETMEEDSMTRMRAVHRRANDGNQQTLKELVTFDEEFIYSTRVGFGLDRLVREAGADLTVDWFDSFGLPISTPDPDAWEPTLAGLLKNLVPKTEADAFRAKLRGSVCRPLFPFGDADAPDLLLSMNMFSLTDVLGSTKENLARSQQDMDNFDEAIKEKLELFEQDKRKEQFEEAALRSEDAVGLQGKKFDVAVSRMNQLASGDVQSGGLLTRLDAILKAPGLTDLMEEKKNLKSTAQSDISLLDSDRNKKYKQNESAIASYNDRVAESRRQLGINYNKQSDLWTEVEGCLEKIAKLGEESRSMVGDHMHMTEVEQKRRKEFSEFKESYAVQRHRLDELVKNCDRGMKFLGDVSEYLQNGRKIITDLKAEEQLQDMLKSEKKQFSKIFYDFAEHSAKIMERLSTRVLGMERSVRNVKFQQQHATDVDDTDLPTYGKQINVAEFNVKTLKRKHEKHLAEFERREKQFTSVWDIVDEEDDEDSSDGEGAEDEILAAGGGDPEDPNVLLLSRKQSPVVRARALIASIRQRYVSEISVLAEEDKEIVVKEKERVQQLDQEVQLIKSSPKKKKTLESIAMPSSSSESPTSSAPPPTTTTPTNPNPEKEEEEEDKV